MVGASSLLCCRSKHVVLVCQGAAIYVSILFSLNINKCIFFHGLEFEFRSNVAKTDKSEKFERVSIRKAYLDINAGYAS